MHGWFLRILIAILAATTLVSCARRPSAGYQPNIFAIPEAIVTASRASDPRLKDELQRRLDAAIAISHRGAPVRKAYLDVAILDSRIAQGAAGFDNSARVQVIARSPLSSEPLFLREFESVSYTTDSALAPAGLADSIAARIRGEFSLAAPAPQSYNPARSISTRLSGQNRPKMPQQGNVRPRADGDALLNANTQFGAGGEIETRPNVSQQSSGTSSRDEPCIVTEDNDCSYMFEN